jgi:hypothetical protein
LSQVYGYAFSISQGAGEKDKKKEREKKRKAGTEGRSHKGGDSFLRESGGGGEEGRDTGERQSLWGPKRRK